MLGYQVTRTAGDLRRPGGGRPRPRDSRFSGFALAQLETLPFPTIGLPFTTATAVLWAYATSLFGRPRRIEAGEGASNRHLPPAPPIDGYRDAGALGAAWRGMMLGLIFDLHVFVGLVAVAVTGTVALVDLVHAYLNELAGADHHVSTMLLLGGDTESRTTLRIPCG